MTKTEEDNKEREMPPPTPPPPAEDAAASAAAEAGSAPAADKQVDDSSPPKGNNENDGADDTPDIDDVPSLPDPPTTDYDQDDAGIAQVDGDDDVDSKAAGEQGGGKKNEDEKKESSTTDSKPEEEAKVSGNDDDKGKEAPKIEEETEEKAGKGEQGDTKEEETKDDEDDSPNWTKPDKDNEEEEKDVAAVVASSAEEPKAVKSEEKDKKASDVTILETVDKKKEDDEPTMDWAKEDEIEVKPAANPFEDDDDAPSPVEATAADEGDIEEGKPKKSKRKFFGGKSSKKEKKPDDWAKEESNVSAAAGSADEVVPAVAATAAAPAFATDGMGGIKVIGIHISEMRLPLVGMFVSATVLLIAVLVFKGKIRWRDYAISVPSATMCLSFLMLLMTCKPDFYTAYGKLPNQITFLWNFVGACLLTFGSPFDTTGNGYFAAWLSVIFSAAALGLTATAFKSTVRGMGALMGLLCCSIIVVIAIVPSLGKDSFYRNEAIYAMCVSVATMVLVLAVIVRQKTTEGKSARGCEGIFAFIVLSIFAIIWVALAAVCTFRGPFLNTGNGYFFSWIGAAMACFAAFASRRQRKAAPAPNEELRSDWAEEEEDSPV